MTNTECPVCLEHKKKKQIKILECNHKVCKECYNKMLNHKIHTCPMCRYNFKSDINNIYYKIRKRRRNLTYEEYVERRQKIKDRYNLRHLKLNRRFCKSTGQSDLFFSF